MPRPEAFFLQGQKRGQIPVFGGNAENDWRGTTLTAGNNVTITPSFPGRTITIATATAGGVAGYSPDQKPQSPNSHNDEFDGTSTVTWTQFGTPDTVDNNSTFPNWVKIEDNDSTACGIYQSFVPGATAFTVACRVSADVKNAGFNYVSLAIKDSANANIVVVGPQNNNAATNDVRDVGTTTNFGTFAGHALTGVTYYLAITRDTGSNYQTYISIDGITWWNVGSPVSATTVARIGLEIDGIAAVATGVYDFVRVFTSQTLVIGSVIDASGTTVTAHNFLSATHPDTVTASPVRGDMIIGNSTPAWSRSAIGSAGSLWSSDGADPSWQTNVKLAGYLRVGSSSAPTNTTAGDLTAVRLKVGDGAFGTGVEMSVTGDGALSGFLRVGSETAPSNTTAGDITGIRGHFGTDAAFTSGYSLEVNAGSMLIGGSHSAVVCSNITSTMTGSGATQYGLSVSPTFTPGASVTALYGINVSPVFTPGTAQTASFGIGFQISASTGATGTLTTMRAADIAMSYGTVKPGTAVGLYIEDIGNASITNVAALHIEGPSAGTNKYVMDINGNGLTHAGGIAGGTAPTGYMDVLIDSVARKLAFY